MKIFSTVLFFSTFFCISGTLYGVDYFDVNNPRFRPLQVVLVTNPPGASTEKIYNAIKENLERTLYFSVVDPVVATASEVAFVWNLQFDNQHQNLQGILKDLKEQRIRREFQVHIVKNDLQNAARELADQTIEEVLNVPGLGHTRIAYTAKPPGVNKHIRLIDFDGKIDERFSYELGASNLAHWSPDGQTLLYTHFTTTSTELALQPLDRPQARLLRFPREIQPLGGSWAPDGDEILVTVMEEGNADIYRYQLKTGELFPLVKWRSLETSPAWSPDGQTISFVSDRKRFRQPGVYMYDIESRKVKRLPFGGKYSSAPRWSPNGRQLLFEGRKEKYFQIFKYNLDTDQIQQLTFGPFNSEQPDWSPNGQQIVFSARRGGVHKLYFMSAYGGRTIRVTNQPARVAETAPAWSK
jgi:TolB protein